MFLANLDLNITPTPAQSCAEGSWCRTLQLKSRWYMMSLQMSLQMFTVHTGVTGHLQPQELSSRVSGLSGAHQRVSTLQRLKPDVLKHDLHQTYRRFWDTQYIVYSQYIHFRKLRPELCWPYPDPQTHAPQPESMSKKLRFLLTFFPGLGQRLKNKLSENLSLSNSHSTRLDQFTSPMTKEGNYGPCWLATVVHLAIPARNNRNNTSRTVKVCESTPRLYEEF